MKPGLLPSGLQRGIPFLVQDNWSAEQALAVIELLDDLREVIWQHYQFPLQELLREQHCSRHKSKSENVNETDPPF